MESRLIVTALGGNALLLRGEPAEAANLHRNVRAAAAELAPLAAENRLVVTHGNGPQVGLLALQSEAYADIAPYPLDVLDAESEGMVGYLLELELRNQLPGREVATLLTQVEVRADDPAMARPSKPVGPVYTARTARRLAAKRGWDIAPDGRGWRRVVPSPEPAAIVELAAVRQLAAAGAIVVCAGGGGIPVVRGGDGRMHGVEGVIDKDLTSALLAEELGADLLMLLTDVPALQHDWGTPMAGDIRTATVEELRAMLFATGSMAPKAEAACRFASRTGRPAVIGALSDVRRLAAGESGTRVVAGAREAVGAPRPPD